MDGLTVSDGVLAYLFAVLLRRLDFSRTCFAKLDSTLFDTVEEFPYRVIWQTAKDFLDAYQRLPSKQEITALIDSRLKQYHEDDEKLKYQIHKRLNLIYDTSVADSELNLELATEFINLLINRYYQTNLSYEIESLNGDYTSFPKLLKAITNGYSNSLLSRTINLSEFNLSTNLGRLRPKVRKYPFGVSFIDAAMDGGGVPGEVYVLLGPTGGGKSLLAQQLCVSSAFQIHASSNVDKSLNCFFSYELKQIELEFRAICQGAKISAARLAELSNGDSVACDLVPAGACFHDQNVLIPERQRIERAVEIINRYCKFFDFSGTPRPSGKPFGFGGINEIVSTLEFVLNEVKLPLRTVVIDWAEACLRNEMQANNIDAKYITFKLGDFVRQVQTEIALRFDCMVFVVHQLAGDVVDRPATKLFHHSNASWCKSFANSATYAFVMGNEDVTTHICRFACTKARRSVLPLPVLIQKTPNLEFVDVSNYYGINNRENSFIQI